MSKGNNSNRIKRVKFKPLTLIKVLDEDTKEYASLQFSIRMGYPRIAVYTKNIPRAYDPNNKPPALDYNTMIIAPFDYKMFMDLLEYMEEVIESKEPIRYSVDCLNVKWVNGAKTNDVYTQATVTIGKDNEGVVFLAATEDKKRKVKFDLLPKLEWHRLKDKNGDLVVDKAFLSKARAKSYLKLIRVLFEGEIKEDGTVVQYEDKNKKSNNWSKEDVKKEEPKKEESSSIDNDLESLL